MTLSKPKKITLLVLLIALAAGGTWYAKHGTAAAAADGGGWSSRFGGKNGGGKGQSQTVKAAFATQSDVPVYLNGLGTVTAANTATVRSRVDGELQRIHFKEGDVVKAGQLLAELDPRTFQVALAQAQGQLASDQANLTNARADLERYRMLLKQDSVAAQKVDTQEALVRQLEGTVKAEQAAVDAAHLQLDYSRVVAPISGRLGLKQVDIGNQIHASDATGIVVITQVQPIYVVFSVPEVQLQSVLNAYRSDQPVTVEAWDRDMKQRLGLGKLTSIDNQVDTTTGTVKLKAEFANTDNSLFPNQFVNARMQVSTLKAALQVPAAAVQIGKAGTYVWAVSADQRANMRTVVVGPRNGDMMVVTDGIKKGEQVVTDGVDRLSDGTQIRLAESADAGQGGDASKGDKPAHPHKHDSAAKPAA
ncbi:MAG: MdtA/MuxA family multidrug efflux RND transporter periplasmic adaptor subunit [Burkholderiales bacterium]|nr:MdtA/MuxA family multidrug efflux RND transporter periplasmic adaptor subunit [Burkholderiales bacterium]